MQITSASEQIRYIRYIRFFFLFRTRNARMERKFRLFCVFRVHVILTTDIQDLTDFHHERKRDNPFNLWSFYNLLIKFIAHLLSK